MRKRGFTLIALILVGVLVCLGMVGCGTTPATYKIGVSQIMTHPALDDFRDGFIAGLAEEGYVEGDNVEYVLQNANGDMSTNQTIAMTLVDENCDLILGISTPSIMAIAEAAEGTDIPIVFGAVTDPVVAGILEDPEHPGGNITGVHDMGPIDLHIDLMLEFFPDLQTIGTIYNPGEPNSLVQIEILRDLCDSNGLQLVEASVATSAEVQAAAISLVGQCDVIYIVTDNTAVAGFEGIVSVCEEYDVPLFAADESSVDRGAIAAIGPSYYAMGEQAGRIAAQILEGADPGEIAVTGAEEFNLVVNTAAADRMETEIPTSVLDEADRIVEE